ncbi:MAG TPA: radical SAM protein [Lachnospiraceae bacterium]|nr:radical SAM protein [Lachnospiraceae bacterium]HPF29568.1 radical SAM protein [Lachnospiraceae bacterium]
MKNIENQMLEKCNLCPRQCMVNRQENQIGYCGETKEVRVARAALHFWEEPCISGKNGSGTVFFCGCNLRCIFCQNSVIAHGEVGKTITTKRLAQIFLELQEKKAQNINLVTPTHEVLAIREAVLLAREMGLQIPIVYNTSAYERVETLQMLEGIVDIYLPDFKYMDTKKANDYSHAKDYPKVAKAAIAEMVRQTKTVTFNTEGMMISGVIVRHLVMPGGVHNARAVLTYLYETYKNDIYVSIMNQYTPLRKSEQFPELNRRVTKREYEKVLAHAMNLGIINAFIQEGATAKESFIPAFNNEGV